MSDAPTLFDADPTPVPPFLTRGGGVGDSAFVFAVPHSGRHYPDSFKRISKLSDHQLRLSEDAFVDDLFAGVPDMGASLIVATYARAYLDLNRAGNEIDPEMFIGPLGDIEPDLSNRVKAGLGLIPKMIGEGLPIYETRLPVREVLKRIRETYTPYHRQLTQALNNRKDHHGRAILIDCHSMPSGSELGRGKRSQPDIILGDCWGASCAPDLTALAERLFLEEGFRVRRNIPYAGGYVTRHYGKPDHDQHALQIEINRRIYMDEERVEKLPHFNDVRDCISKIVGKLIDMSETVCRPSSGQYKKAAE